LVYFTVELTTEYARVQGFLTVACVCGDKDGVRREIRDFLATLRARHPGIPDSISAALGNVNPYTLSDLALTKAGTESPQALHSTAT
jgi:hypothetical protein